MKGLISSEESMGLMDGPGIRYVVFLQGCHLRCSYCHNPETWDKHGKSYLVEPNALIEKIERYKPYFGDKGGVTFSGGEPLLQPKFLLECLKLCKERGINTAIDTAGVSDSTDEQLKEILSYCDLVILDIKAVKEEDYKKLTGQTMNEFKRFLRIVQECKNKLWLRQVIVPTLNDNEKNILNLKEFISKIENVEKVELLPYKTLGESKYKTLGMKYRLVGVPEMDEKRCKELEKLLLS